MITGLTLGITMGCPVGVGPEIIIKAIASGLLPPRTSLVIIGDEGVARRNAARFGIPINFMKWRQDDPTQGGGVFFHSVSNLSTDFDWGCPTEETAVAMARYIEEGVRLHLAGSIQGLVTCPINKLALKKAGIGYPGHTEMLADLCGARDFAMMMAGETLRVSLATIHVALRDVPRLLSTSSLARLITLTAASLKQDFAIPFPRLALAGLNPHAGEEGLFGMDEETIIRPAIEISAAPWFQVDGPMPPDTVFLKAVTGGYDAVICMYHDQGLIPFKLLHFKDGVNVTIGLPIVRTSVDHGTAYDIAGKGVADPGSLLAALFMAARIAANRLKAEGAYGEH